MQPFLTKGAVMERPHVALVPRLCLLHVGTLEPPTIRHGCRGARETAEGETAACRASLQTRWMDMAWLVMQRTTQLLARSPCLHGRAKGGPAATHAPYVEGSFTVGCFCLIVRRHCAPPPNAGTVAHCALLAVRGHQNNKSRLHFISKPTCAFSVLCAWCCVRVHVCAPRSLHCPGAQTGASPGAAHC